MGAESGPSNRTLHGRQLARLPGLRAHQRLDVRVKSERALGVGKHQAVIIAAVAHEACYGAAARATANLVQTPHVRVVHGDGTQIAFEPADVIYVNAGATRPGDAWLDRLKEGGRLILPLTADAFRTAMCGGEPCSGSSGTARNFWRADLWDRDLSL